MTEPASKVSPSRRGLTSLRTQEVARIADANTFQQVDPNAMIEAQAALRRGSYHTVCEGIVVGDKYSPGDLVSNGVSPALIVALHEAPSYPSDCEVCSFTVNDTPSAASEMKAFLHGVLPRIREAVLRGGLVLIHCREGISRSATVAAAYYIRYLASPSQSVNDVLGVFQLARPQIAPNLGFMALLMSYACECRAGAS